MTSMAWAIFLCGLFACDMFSTLHKKPGEEFYTGAGLIATLVVFSFVMLIVASIKELSR